MDRLYNVGLAATCFILFPVISYSSSMSDLKFCKALAEVASLAATAREAGMSSFVMKDDLENILQENGSVDFKDSLNEVVDTIYASPAISPERAKNLYLETCMENMLSEPE